MNSFGAGLADQILNGQGNLPRNRVSTKYESTAKAPDSLLRLGQSLAELGEKEAACASLGEVLRKYPRASLGVKQGVDREQKRAHC